MEHDIYQPCFRLTPLFLHSPSAFYSDVVTPFVKSTNCFHLTIMSWPVNLITLYKSDNYAVLPYDFRLIPVNGAVATLYDYGISLYDYFTIRSAFQSVTR